MNYTKFYYKCHRADLAQHIISGNNRILDVGCAEGMLGKTLKEKGLASEVVGIEICPDAAKVAETMLDRVVCGDIEIQREKQNFEQESFDYIICGDVLEHLYNPWEVLDWLVTLLKTDGLLIVSLPNVRHWSVIFSLVFLGEWEYQPHGIMDRTHLRFFTKKTAVQLLIDSGIHVLSCEGSHLKRKKDKLVKLLLLGMGTEFVSKQWTLIGKKNR